MAIELKKLGNAIRFLRQKRGLSQSGLGKRAGLSQAAIAWIEQGRRSVSLDALNSLGNALDVPAECLTILGSAEIEKSKDANAFLASLQKLIFTTVEAREEARAGSGQKRRPRRRAAVKLVHA